MPARVCPLPSPVAYLMTRFDTQRYRPILVLSLVYLGVSLLLRLVLWQQFGKAADVALADLPHVLLAGGVNDLVELVYLMIPLSLYLFLLPQRWLNGRLHSGLLALGGYATLFGMLYLAVTEYYFFEEYDARSNLVAVNYLAYSHEVLINIRDSYPVYQVLAADALLSGLLLRLLWPGERLPAISFVNRERVFN